MFDESAHSEDGMLEQYEHTRNVGKIHGIIGSNQRHRSDSPDNDYSTLRNPLQSRDSEQYHANYAKSHTIKPPSHNKIPSNYSHLASKKYGKMAKEIEMKTVGSASTIIDTTKRRCELWEGKNKFFCGGKLMTGFHSGHLFMTLAMFCGTYAIFLALLLPLLNIPMLSYIGVALFVSTVIFLLLTAFTDPGIIPRRPPSQLLESMSAEMREKVQYCHTCRIVRPPRAKHCRYCDNCVEVFDHHCPWTGTCIGIRNYGYFIIFISLTTISGAYACGAAIYVIVLWAEGIPIDHMTEIKIYVRDSVAPLLCTWALVVSLLVGALLAFHIFLISKGLTTNEFLRGVKPTPSDYKKSHNSDKIRFCCQDIPPSKLLPMWEKRSAEDETLETNAIAHAIETMRQEIEGST
jgi:palmitoyltransferase ZDHHC9/14/18